MYIYIYYIYIYIYMYMWDACGSPAGRAGPFRIRAPQKSPRIIYYV